MNIFFCKEISSSEAKYKIDSNNVLNKSKGGGQASYNLPQEFFVYCKKNGVLVTDDLIDYCRKNNDGSAYVLSKEYKLELGDGVLWIIGDAYKDRDNKFIASVNGSNGKLQMYRTVYLKLDSQDYEWFVKLYDRNLYGNKLVFLIDLKNKILKIDVEFQAIKNSTEKSDLMIDIKNNKVDFKYNRIVFGAPGTGKSHKINKDKGVFGDRYERVTFHPNYSYGQFVGTYKPIPSIDESGINSITYEYVPGPFMRSYVEALKKIEEPYLLIIEEINRANVAAVFGDIFQLLDRKNGKSEYPIETSNDVREYLAKELYKKNYESCSKLEKEKCNTMQIPSNMYIWSTMNSGDQGVYPMDTAFKRRWSFEYIGIDENEEQMSEANFLLNRGTQIINWNELRKAINKQLSNKNINEDKLLGPFFLSNEIIKENDSNHIIENNDRFLYEFKSKVLMYLFDDVCKQHKNYIFNDKYDIKRYSSICKTFDEKGLDVFVSEISSTIKITDIALDPKEIKEDKNVIDK